MQRGIQVSGAGRARALAARCPRRPPVQPGRRRRRAARVARRETPPRGAARRAGAPRRRQTPARARLPARRAPRRRGRGRARRRWRGVPSCRCPADPRPAPARRLPSPPRPAARRRPPAGRRARASCAGAPIVARPNPFGSCAESLRPIHGDGDPPPADDLPRALAPTGTCHGSKRSKKRRIGMRTPLCDVLGIDVPVICAPFGPWEEVELAAAVCAAGGLGSLGTAVRPLPDLQAQWARLRRLHDPPLRHQPHRAAVRPGGVRGDPGSTPGGHLLPPGRPRRAGRARPPRRDPLDTAGHGRHPGAAGRGARRGRDRRPGR